VSQQTAPRRQASAILWCLLAGIAALLGGWFLKSRCLNITDLRLQFQHLCYSDVQALYTARGIDHGVFPYIHGTLRDGSPAQGAIEYPVLTGLFMWTVGQVTNGLRQYVELSAVLLGAATLAASFLLAHMKGFRALLWPMAPAVVLYAFHNWDVLAVLAVIVGLLLWSQGRKGAAAIAFGVGAALKLFPLLFLPALFFDSLFDGLPKRGVSNVFAGAGCFVAFNIPIAAINIRGWWATYLFQSVRPPNHDSLWSLGGRLVGNPDITQINIASTTLILVSLVAIYWAAWVLARRTDQYPFLQVCAATLAAVLLWSKVQSPQYTLWILPFFVILDMSLVWWALYSIVDVLVYVGVFRFFYDYSRVASATFHLGIWLRTGLLLALIPTFLYATSATMTRRAVRVRSSTSPTAASV
jgi:uncharacterized membrane protein